MKILNIIFMMISFLIILISFKSKNNKNNNQVSDKTKKIFLAVVLITSSILLFSYLGSIPYGLHVDEAGMGYDALSLARYGVDRWLYTFPLYFINFGGGQNALYTHLASLFVKFFGLSTYVIRMPAAILGIVSIIYFYKLIMKTKNDKLALITTTFMVICPFTIMKSRWGLESYLLFPLLVMSLYYFSEAIAKESNKYYIISGLLFGLTLYTYAISYIIVALYMFVMIIYLLIIKKIKFKNIILFGIPLGILAIPLIYMVLKNSGVISFNINFGIFSVPDLWFYRGGEISFSNIKDNLNIYRILLSNDRLYYNVFPRFGTLYYLSIPLMLCGFIISFINGIKTLKNKKIDINLLILILGGITLFTIMLLSKPNVNKANAIFIPLIYFVGLGLYFCYKNSKVGIRILSVLYLINFSLFIKYYFIDYPKDIQNKYYFVAVDDFNEALSSAKEIDHNYIYFGRDTSGQTYIYTLMYDKMSPYEFNETVRIENNKIISYDEYIFDIGEEEDYDSVYIFTKDNSNIERFIDLGFKIEEHNNFVLLYY